jgi:hypothetical protein
MDVRHRLVAMIDDLLGNDPRAALVALPELRDEQVPWLEARAVALARRERWSWAKIGRVLQRSRQQLNRQYRVIVPTVAHDHLRERNGEVLHQRRVLAEIAEGQRRGRRQYDEPTDAEAVPW